MKDATITEKSTEPLAIRTVGFYRSAVREIIEDMDRRKREGGREFKRSYFRRMALLILEQYEIARKAVKGISLGVVR